MADKLWALAHNRSMTRIRFDYFYRLLCNPQPRLLVNISVNLFNFRVFLRRFEISKRSFSFFGGGRESCLTEIDLEYFFFEKGELFGAMMIISFDWIEFEIDSKITYEDRRVRNF